MMRDTGADSAEFGKSENTLLSKVVALKWTTLLYIQTVPSPVRSESLGLYDSAYVKNE